MLPKRNDAKQRLNEITLELGEVKQHIRQIALTEAKIAKELLAKMNNLERMMDDVFPDLMNEIESIGKRLDNLNADFFSKIFGDILKKELKEHGKNQSMEVKEQVDAGLKDL